MIWLLAQPLPSTSPVSKLDRRHTGRLRNRDKLLVGEGEGGWRKTRSRIIRLQKSLDIYKPFSTLCFKSMYPRVTSSQQIILVRRLSVGQKVGCPRKWFFDYPRNTEFFEGFKKFRGIFIVKICRIPRNFGKFLEIQRNSAEFRGILRNSAEF